MLPMKDVRLLIGDTLASVVPLAQASALNRLALVKAAFTPDENMSLADLTLADFDGSTAKTIALGNQQVGISPVTGDQIITIVEPVGGFRWQVTGLTNLPQTIYGYALYDSTGPGPLIAVETLPTPITLTDEDQEVNIGSATLVISQTPIV